MSEEVEFDGPEERWDGQEEAEPKIVRLSGMYQNYFLDYASYVILERAVPALEDGLKPVQRRILHALRDMDDGRYHKVANVIGQTMKFHPHGDASIGDALVQLGQKDLLIDAQGNWGNILTGDNAAAPRYIEARLTKFALEVAFNPKTTYWQSSYDGRAKEPINLPMKFPLLLAQGVEGIAVGLSTKILPHNFNELIDGSIQILKGKKAEVFPDFPTGGIADFSQYHEGRRGGKVRIRAKIHQEDKKTLVITEIPFGTTTGSLIDSIIKANDKGKIKIKKIEDNTAEKVEILVHLPPGLSPDKTIDALYAFTDCEVSISPLCCVIFQDRPEFLGVTEILERSTIQTKGLLKRELEIALDELEEQWHFASLERIFIEHKIYRDIEEAETWEEVLSFIRKGLNPHISHLKREITEEDLVRLTEIRIKRISKFDKSKADDHILDLEGRIEAVLNNLNNLTEFAIAYFKELKRKYGTGRERKTEIRLFDTIEATKVAIANEKFYVDREEGFVGTGLKKAEFLFDCSDLDDVIVFRRDGSMLVTKVDQKTYVGKDILHVDIFKKNDKRTIYNMVYRDGPRGNSYWKRFSVTGVTRDREYDLTAGNKGSEVLYFSANPNGEAEVIAVILKPIQKLKKLKFDLDFSELAIKGRASKGNQVSKYPVKKIEMKEKGVSTLAPRKIWFDESIKRLNVDGRGELLGAFRGEDKILEINTSGTYRTLGFDLSTHFDEEMTILEKWDQEKAVSAIYFEGEKKKYFVKRFLIEGSEKKESFISESAGSSLLFVTTKEQPVVRITFRKEKDKDREPMEINLEEFIAIKGLKAQGNQLTADAILKVELIGFKEEEEPLPPAEPEMENEVEEEELHEAPKNKEEGGEGISQISLF